MLTEREVAINSGVFDDEDAEGVKGLDNLGDPTGRLYAQRHLQEHGYVLSRQRLAFHARVLFMLGLRS